MKEHSYMAFLQEAKQFIPQERIYTDELRRLAWGTDAGFYRLIPQIVIRSKDEDEPPFQHRKTKGSRRTHEV